MPSMLVSVPQPLLRVVPVHWLNNATVYSQSKRRNHLIDGREENKNANFRSSRMDLHENPETKTVTVMMELPGLKSEDTAIEVNGNRLTVSGETKRSQNHEKGTYVVQERSYGKFSRSIQIPQGIKVGPSWCKLLARYRA